MTGMVLCLRSGQYLNECVSLSHSERAVIGKSIAVMVSSGSIVMYIIAR